jgi:hypothetical protein
MDICADHEQSLHQAVPDPVDANLSEPRNARRREHCKIIDRAKEGWHASSAVFLG